MKRGSHLTSPDVSWDEVRWGDMNTPLRHWAMRYMKYSVIFSRCRSLPCLFFRYCVKIRIRIILCKSQLLQRHAYRVIHKRVRSLWQTAADGRWWNLVDNTRRSTCRGKIVDIPSLHGESSGENWSYSGDSRLPLQQNVGQVKGSVHAKTELGPFSRLDTTPACDRQTDRQTQSRTQHIPCERNVVRVKMEPAGKSSVSHWITFPVRHKLQWIGYLLIFILDPVQARCLVCAQFHHLCRRTVGPIIKRGFMIEANKWRPSRLWTIRHSSVSMGQ